MKRIIAIAAFSLTAAAMILAVGSRIVASENRLARGEKIKIRIAAYDPSDLLRGRYLALRPRGFSQSDLAPASIDALGPNARAYAVLEKDADGFSSIATLSRDEPHSLVYLVLSCDASGLLEPPFDRFYLNQEDAPEADGLIRKNAGKDAYVVAYLKEGGLTLGELRIGERSFCAGRE